MKYIINKVGIIGAGTMGSGIAAHLANIGIDVVLLDIVTPDLTPEEQDDPVARNRLAKSLFDRMLHSRPANLAREDREKFIKIGNVEDDFQLLRDCDWIIEVIIEKLEPKQELMSRIAEIRKPACIVSSNTSGIPIYLIAEGQSDEFKAHFLGTHFFNPPRYLKLLEVIPTVETSQDVINFMTKFGTDTLGKGVVLCKDTPNFIGNRFFAIANSFALEYAFQKGYKIEEVDALTGPLIGRPKTATFRLLDLIGLDVMGHVSLNLYEAIPDDPQREALKGEKSRTILGQMLENKWYGNKVDQGFYKKTFVNGNREFWTLDVESLDYTPPQKVRFESVGEVRKIESLSERLPALLGQPEDRAVKFVRDTLYYALAYAAQVAPEIAYNVVDIDNAIRWGFTYEAGPFELWDMLGLRNTTAAMEANGYNVADWVKEMLEAGHESFYQNGSYYDFDAKCYTPKPIDVKKIATQQLKESTRIVQKNLGASLLDMGDGVALLEMHSPKINALDADFIDMAELALDRLDSDFDALVIGNNGQDFCIGMNLALVVIAAAQGLWDQIDQLISRGQKVFFDLRHAPRPVVTAPHQRVLGGGVELTMAGWGSVADHETYLGFTEIAVGVIPGGGGCKELLRRKVNPVMRTKNADVLPVMEEILEQLALAKVGTSAWEDKSLGYLLPDDEIVMNGDHRPFAAKQKALYLVETGARPPEVELIYAAGRDALSALQMGIHGLGWGGYASEYDMKIGHKLVQILTGGNLSSPTWVDPWYILDLEREAILSLIGEPKTQERMSYMLQKGKPLRN